jgi:cyclophilin family peptidyl-prolyl cis-trans isomerase
VLVVAAVLAYQWWLVPNFLFFQSFEGTIVAIGDKPDFEKSANLEAPMQHVKPDWQTHDYMWRVEEPDGSRRTVQVPFELWQQAVEGQRVTKKALRTLPVLGAVPEPAEEAGEPVTAVEEAEPPAEEVLEAGERFIPASADVFPFEELDSPPLTPAGEMPASYLVKFECTHGDFVAEFYNAWAPLGYERVYELTAADFFDDARFFRVMPEFIVQFGLPADPMVYRQWRDSALEDEPRRLPNTRGTISFAKSGPNTRTTQLFVNLADNAMLDAQDFTPVGQVVWGIDVVDGINAEYGEQPNQGRIQQAGNAYLDEQYPNLTAIERAVFVKRAPDLDVPETFDVRFETTEGAFTARFHRDWAPLGVARVHTLVTEGLWDGTAFFRVVDGYFAQFGIPADPELAGVWSKATIQDDYVTHTNARGTIALAEAGPNTRAVQAVVNLRDNPELDALGYAPVGEVVEGMDVLEAVNAEHGREPKQGRVVEEGDAYLRENFPGLSYITDAEVVSASGTPVDTAEADVPSPLDTQQSEDAPTASDEAAAEG